MIKLTTVNQKLQAQLAGAITTNQLPIDVSYSDADGTTYVGGTQLTNTNSGTLVDICASPAASTVRDIDLITVYNNDTVNATVSIIFNNNGTSYLLTKVTLSTGDSLTYTHGDGWKVTTSVGGTKINSLTSINNRVVAVPDATSITPNGDTTDILTQANTQSVGTLTINAPTGSPTSAQKLTMIIKSTNVQTFSWNAIYEGTLQITLPATSSGSSLVDEILFIYSPFSAKWILSAVNFGAA